MGRDGMQDIFTGISEPFPPSPLGGVPIPETESQQRVVCGRREGLARL